MRTIAAIQARLGSTRLPQKVLADLGGKPMLRQIAARLEAAATVDEVVLATTQDPGDDALVAAAESWGMGVHRGPVDDLVVRYLGAAEAFDADVIVRVWGDCPFVDPAVVDLTVRCLWDEQLDYASTARPPGRTYPLGLDIEVYRTDLLRAIVAASEDPFFREFPLDYVDKHVPPERVGGVRYHEDVSQVHLTVDYAADLALAQQIYAALDRPGEAFDVDAIVRWVRSHPDAYEASEALARNAEYEAKKSDHGAREGQGTG